MGVKGIANMDLLVYGVGLRLESDVLSDGTVAEVGRRRMNSDLGGKCTYQRQSQPNNGGRHSHNVAPNGGSPSQPLRSRKELVLKRKNKIASKKSQDETQFDGFQGHSEVQASSSKC
ncbi:hypothetical protein Tco_1065186 [Tanacetum coccineum]